MKFFRWIIFIILILFFGVISIAFLYLQSSRPVYHGEVHLKGIKNVVKIHFDNHGIPHIRASNEKDAFFALGYVHSQERLFQMELLRRVASGRLAEVLGEDLVPVDAFFRTIGIHKSAKESAALFFSRPNEPWQENTLSYIKGINAFMFQGPTPPEFLLLGIPKVKFTPEDIYLITGYMSFSFAEALRTDPIFDIISKKLGSDYVDAFQWGKPVHTPIDSTSNNASEIALITDHVFNLLPIPPWLGSNAWVLAPSKSKSGKVLFANDTHIGYQQPAVWYEAHMEYPGFSVYGNYLAGMPYPLVGHNRNISWGLTMFENDDMNLYREKSDGDFPGSFKYKGTWEKFKIREEIIGIKDKPDTVIIVRESVHGPVINDVVLQLDSTESEPITLWWTYTRFPATAIQVTHQLSNAKNMDDARTAASMVNAPGLNILYGDIDGNIASWSAAKLPIFPDGINTKLILDGSSGKDDILGYYDFAQNPQVENPASGYVYSANQDPGFIGGKSYPGYYAPNDRSDRIKTIIDSQEKWSLHELEKISTDVISVTHPVNASIILEVLRNDPVLDSSLIHRAVAKELNSWKGSHLLSDVAPTIYYKLLANIFEMSMMDELGEENFRIFVNTHLMKNSYTAFLSNDNSKWWDNINTTTIVEKRKTIFSAAFDKTVKDMVASSGNISNWSWGGFHTLEHVHPMGRKSPLDKIFNVGPFPIRGGIETINNAGFAMQSEGVFKVSYGPAMRILIDFNDLENGLSVLPTGQSGHVRSPYYNDQSPLHIAGKFRPMMMNKKEIETKCTNILTLRPD